MTLQALFILGICVEAMTGAIAAGRKQMDFFGVILIAAITALGGGTVRDVLLNTHPTIWVTNPEYLLYTSAFAVITIIMARSLSRLRTAFLVLDALGLAVFVILGTEKVLNLGMSPAIGIVSGMITGICGGMLRDILCNDIPLVLRRELYAVIALAGSALYITLVHFHLAHHLNVAVTMAFIFISRLLAIFFHLEIPRFDYSALARPPRDGL